MKSVQFSCIGDLLSADTEYTLGIGIGKRLPGIIAYYSMNENKLFVNSDIVFCNLESPITISSDHVNLPFAGNPAIIQMLKSLNICIVSIANNHILDHGQDGLFQTLDSLSENGIPKIGLKENMISNISYLEIKDKKFAFAAFNAIQYNHENKSIASLERDIIYRTLEEINIQSPDFKIFSIHWGDEYVPYPSPFQVDLAHELIDKGVDVIIGHHPHVVQPVEKYKNGVIIYSLGNFLFDMFWSENVRNGIQVDLFFDDNYKIDYSVKHFRIRSDFTHDFINTKAGIQIFERSQIKFKKMIESPRHKYESIYIKECKKNRLKARLLMKIYLIRNIFKLSTGSRKVFLNNIRKKMLPVWIRN